MAASARWALVLGVLIVIASVAGFLAFSPPRPSATGLTTQAVSESATSSISQTSATESTSQTESILSGTESSSTQSSSMSNGTSTNESLGSLELLASANTTIQTGQNLTIAISLVNASPSPLIIPASNDWRVHGFPVAMWGGCTGLEPVEFIIVRGNYTLEDLQAASANASIPQGGCMEGGSITYLSFQGEGSGATADGTFCEANCFPDSNNFDLDSNFTVRGYWAYPINSSERADVFTPPHPECIVSGVQDCSTFNYPEVGPFAQHLFVPGSYTLTVADEWGQAAVLHFTVGGYSTLVAASLGKAVGYLIRNYNPGIGLIPETPNSVTYWLYSDNYLAALALQRYGEGNATVESVAQNITRSLNAYLSLNDISGADNQYLVLNSSVPCEFSASQNYSLRGPDTALIKVTLNNGTGQLSENKYADIAFLSSVCLYRQGNTAGAMAAYETGKLMFDKEGLNDSVFANPGPGWMQYQTFKLALYIYASALLHQQVDPSAVSILLWMQGPGGGFFTGYDWTLSHDGTLTNTETTSLAILALEAISGG